MDFTEKKSGFQGGEGGKTCTEKLPMRSRRKLERVSRRNSSPIRSAKCWYHTMFGKESEMGKKVGRRRARS